MQTTFNRPLRVSKPVTFPQRLVRGFAGFCLGWVWCSVLSLVWVGVAAIWYSGLESALSQIKDETWATVAFSGYLGCVFGSWAGSTASPLALGSCKLRWPIRTSSFAGAISGAVIGVWAGFVMGWLEDGAKLSKDTAEFVMWLAALSGAVVGFRVGRKLTRITGEPEA